MIGRGGVFFTVMACELWKKGLPPGKKKKPGEGDEQKGKKVLLQERGGERGEPFSTGEITFVLKLRWGSLGNVRSVSDWRRGRKGLVWPIRSSICGKRTVQEMRERKGSRTAWPDFRGGVGGKNGFRRGKKLATQVRTS